VERELENFFLPIWDEKKEWILPKNLKSWLDCTYADRIEMNGLIS